MRKMTVVVGALAALGLFGFGCNDTRPAANNGTGGSGYVDTNQSAQDPKLGDGKIGNSNGVIDDGEGPLEGKSGKADDQVGSQPGVWNDGEGPIERSPLNRPSDSGKSFNSNAANQSAPQQHPDQKGMEK